MFDTMTLTKVVGGLCGTLLVFLLGGWAADIIYSGGGGHGEVAQAYSIPVEEGGEGGVATSRRASVFHGGEEEGEEVVGVRVEQHAVHVHDCGALRLLS